MKRVRELITKVKEKHPTDSFFDDLDEIFKVSSLAKQQYQAYEDAFSYLDLASWQILSQKALKHFTDHREGQLKQGFFNQLNEAFAYQFLVQSGYENVRFLNEDKQRKTPDLVYQDANIKRYCEVKTISRSDEDIKRFEKIEVFDAQIYRGLSEGFFKKLNDDLKEANEQIASQEGDGLVFVIVNFDDFTLTYYEQYHKQITEFLSNHEVPEVYMKIGLFSDKKIQKKREI